MQPQPTQGDPKSAEMFRKLVIAATKIIHDPAVAPQLVQILKSAGDPAQGIARAAAVVIKQMQEKIKGANPNVVYAAAPAIAAMVADLGRAAGIFQPTKQLLQQALQIITQQGAQAPAPAQPGLLNQGAPA